jgi:type IV pilus assembly protein PilM
MLAEKFGSALDVFKTKSPSLIGVDIASTSIKLIELSQTGKGTFKLERYAIEALAQGHGFGRQHREPRPGRRRLKRGWKRLGSRNRNIAMALPAAMVITKKIIVPAGQKEEELELAVEAEANQYIPFALDEVNLDFQILGPRPTIPTKSRS